jgi:hypothetical protein
MTISIFLHMLAGIGLVALILRLGILSYFYDAKIGNSGIDFFVLSVIKAHSLPYAEIERVKHVGFAGMFVLNAVNFCNRFPTKAFLIEKRTGLITRRILITPEDASHLTMVLAREGIPCD